VKEKRVNVEDAEEMPYHWCMRRNTPALVTALFLASCAAPTAPQQQPPETAYTAPKAADPALAPADSERIRQQGARFKAAMDVTDAIMEEWQRCLWRGAAAMAGMSEPAETIVKASFGACARLENQMRSSMVDGPITTPDALFREIKERWEPRLLAVVMARRAVRSTPPRPAPIPGERDL
jgi:hypothetical protein